ncbi:MAG: SPOR domain-containing protein [Muribaculaceae bacterium]|nr:SPOR domain-containing protein [Muribaculaceae bacterium]
MRRSKIASRLPQYPAYLVFESPYWRVRVGDFTTRTEAESAMAEIRRAFPSFSSDLRIVKSRIK